jgi:polar amino acid transport system substrate-binding protein
MNRILVICLSLLLTSLGYAQTPLKLGAEDSWAPYSDKHGQGISTNIIKAAFNEAGIVVTIQVRGYARVLQDVKAGTLDAGYNVTRQKNTEQEFIFGAEPIFQANAYWYFLNTDNEAYGSLNQIPEGYRVGGIIDYEYGDAYELQRYKLKEVRVPRQAQLIKMLQQGRIDAAVMFEEEAKQALKDMKLPPDTLKRGMLNHTSDIHLAFSRKNPHSHELAEKFDWGIRKLKETGQYERLLVEPVSVESP